jgi:peptide/nickel transport system permease protein
MYVSAGNVRSPGAPLRRVGAMWRSGASHRVVRLVARRLALAVPLLLIVSAISFILLYLTPGDAANQILGAHGNPAQYAALRNALGLNRPVYEQYYDWLHHAVTGNLGTSLLSGVPVGQSIAQRLGVSISLIVGSLLVSILVGIALGALSAIRRGILGRAVDGLSLLGFALPAFWVAAELVVLFAVKLRWLSATGYVSPLQSVSQWLRSLVLPVASLSLYGVAVVAKQSRDAMLEALSSEHIQIARANGWSPRSLVFRHALRHAAIRVVTVLGLLAVGLVGGTVFVENVFVLPGLGSLVVNAAVQHDVPVVQGVTVCMTVVVVVINLVVDLAYAWLDPRVTTG